jgi:hypothetical protein
MHNFNFSYASLSNLGSLGLLLVQGLVQMHTRVLVGPSAELAKVFHGDIDFLFRN